MEKISNILLIIDGEYPADELAGEAVTIARKSGAKVTLLSALDTPPDQQEREEESSSLQQWIAGFQQWIEDVHLEHLKRITSELDKNGIPRELKRVSGKPWLEIIRETIRGDYDLILKPAGRETTEKSILFGGTDMQLFRMCPAPVWVFKPTGHTDVRNVMVAVDLLPVDEEKSALADNVLQWGKHIADLSNAKLHVIHAYNLYGEDTLRGRSVLANTVDKLVQDEEKKHHQWLNEALVKNGIQQSETKVHFHKGEAKKWIPAIASIMNVDLLIIGTVGRTGIPGFFIGNTADSVLRQLDCSALAIKPGGFATPVTL